jgi:hypothetical protein
VKLEFTVGDNEGVCACRRHFPCDERDCPCVDNHIDDWHDGHGLGISLHEYLAWSWEDYLTWVRAGQ